MKQYRQRRRQELWRLLIVGVSASCVSLGLCSSSGSPPPRMWFLQQGAATPEKPDAELEQLWQTGLQAVSRRDFAAAEKAFQAGLEQAQARSNRSLTARFLNALGYVNNSLSQYDKAVDYYTQAIEIRKKLPDQGALADSLYNMGVVYTRMRQYDKALDYHTQALTIRKQLPNQSAIANSLNDLGVVYIRLSQYAKALDYYTQAIEIRKKLPDQSTLADTLTNLGNVYFHLGQYDRALDYHAQGLAIRKQLPNRSALADSLNNLGSDYTNLGQVDKALDYLRQALAIYKQLPDQSDLAISLYNLGSAYNSLGQFDRALDYLSQAIDIFRKLPDQNDLANCLTSLGRVYYSLGQFDRALDYYSQALVLFRKLPDLSGLARNLANLGSDYTSLGQVDKALDYHMQALTIRKQLSNPSDLANCLNDLGSDYTDLGQYDKALDYLRQALVLSRKLPEQSALAYNLNKLGIVYFRLGQFDRALDYLRQAHAIYKQLPDQSNFVASLTSLGLVYANLGQYAKARQHYEQAMRTLETTSLQVGEASQMSHFQQMYTGNFYAQYARLLLKQSQPQQALQMAERGRGQGLARQAAQNHLRFARFLSAEDDAQQTQREQELTQARRILLAIQQQQPRPEQTGEYAAWQQRHLQAKQQYEEAERGYTRLRDQLLVRYPDYSRAQGQHPPAFSQLQALAQHNPDTLYLEWLLLDDKRTLLFALSAKAPLHAFVLPVGDKALNALIPQWRNAILARLPDEPKLAQALYKRLLGPAEQKGLLRVGRYAHLVLVGDGPLLDLPFAALRDGHGKRLIERYALSCSISLGLLSANHYPQPLPSATLLCIADPLGPAAQAGELPLATKRGMKLGPLKQAREEASQITRLLQKSHLPGLQVLLGSEAREARVKNEMGHYALLHFATHGLLSVTDAYGPVKNGLHAGLLLAPEPSDSQEDGILEAREIVDIALSAQLAVLSACQTAQGQQGRGDGLVGLAWAFRAAGCPCIVGSQWSVQDAATSRLMVAFYRHLLGGLRKDEALRQAMLGVKGTKGLALPYQWAGFEVIGDTRPLVLSATSAAARK